MKRHLKHLIITMLVAVCAVCCAFGIAACDKSGGGNGGPTALAAPVLDLSGNVLSWNPVDHADGYQVFENGVKKADTTETTYTIPDATLAVPGLYKYTVKAISSDPNYTESPMSNERQKIVSIVAVDLDAPDVYLNNDTLITWDAVANADGYYVFKNNVRVTVVMITDCQYAIEREEKAGEYVYTVQAVSADTLRYNPSAKSQPITITVEQLPAPVIQLDEENAIITWDEVENADGYDVYVDNATRIATNMLQYEITQTPGIHRYTVVATSTSVLYTSSNNSNRIEFDVPVIAMIRVRIPVIDAGSTEKFNVTVGLYNGAECVVSEQLEIQSDISTNTTVKLIADKGSYIAKLEGLTGNYVATSARIDEKTVTGTIDVIERTGDNELTVDSKSLTVTLTAGADDLALHLTKQYLFTAGATVAGDGVHTLKINESEYADKSLSVSANGIKIIDTVKELYIGTFTAEEGEVVVLTFEFEKELVEGGDTSAQLTFNFEFLNKEEKQYLLVLTNPYSVNASGSQLTEQETLINSLTGSCNRYLTLTAAQKYSFFFGATTGNRTITLTVTHTVKDGNTTKTVTEEFTTIGSGILDIDFSADAVGSEIQIKISVENNSYGGLDVVKFWVYPTPPEPEEE